MKESEGGPFLTWPEPDPAEKLKLLWACKCGRGGTANLRFDCDAEASRAEVERQVLEHLREDGHDWRHNVHVGMFAESFMMSPDGELRWREAGSAPDTYGPHPRLSFGGAGSPDPFADKAAQRGG